MYENISHALTAPIHIKKIGRHTQVYQESCRNVCEKLSLWNPRFLFLTCFPAHIPGQEWFLTIFVGLGLIHCKISPFTADHSDFSSLCTAQLLYCIHVFSSDLGIFCFDFNWYITYFCLLFLTTHFTLVSSIFLGNAFIKDFIVPS